MPNEEQIQINIETEAGYTPVKGVDYFTVEEQQVFVNEIMSHITEPKDGKDAEPVDYSKIESFIIEEVAKIPKPKDGVDGVSPTVDINSIVVSVLELIPKQPDIVVDYKFIEKFCEEKIIHIERSRPRLNSGGPTTRLGEISDVSITKPTNSQVLKYNSTTGKWENGEVIGGIQSITAGINITVNNTDPLNPIVSSLSDRYKTSSTTSNSIVPNGTLTFTVDANLAYTPEQDVIIAHNSANHMHATVVAYSGTTLVVDVKHKTGSGTYSSWSINLDGIAIDNNVPESGSVTRTGNYISTITKGTTVYTLTRTGNYVTGITDGTFTWTINRDGNNRITNWIVV